MPETRDCRPAAVPFPKKEARPAEKGSRYVGLAFIFLGALLHNLAAEGALAKALLGGGGGDREGSRHVSEESKFVHYRDLEAGYRWRLRSPDGESLAESPPDTGVVASTVVDSLANTPPGWGKKGVEERCNFLPPPHTTTWCATWITRPFGGGSRSSPFSRRSSPEGCSLVGEVSPERAYRQPLLTEVPKFVIESLWLQSLPATPRSKAHRGASGPLETRSSPW